MVSSAKQGTYECRGGLKEKGDLGEGGRILLVKSTMASRGKTELDSQIQKITMRQRGCPRGVEGRM